MTAAELVEQYKRERRSRDAGRPHPALEIIAPRKELCFHRAKQPAGTIARHDVPCNRHHVYRCEHPERSADLVVLDRPCFTGNARIDWKDGRHDRKRHDIGSCLDCTLDKSRSMPIEQPDPLTFVWIYWHGGAQGDELRWSMRSVHEHYQGNADYLVIGDPPGWYRGPRLYRDRVKPQSDQRYRDTLNKIHAACRSSYTPDRFCWMMDDIYFLQPTSFADLSVHRYKGELSTTSANPRHSWHNQVARSARAVEAAGLHTRNWCTHLPHIVDKDRWLYVWEKYHLARQVLSWEICYGAEFWGEGEWWGDFYQRVPEPFEPPTGHIVSNGEAGWCRDLQSYLAARFPERSPHEEAGESYHIASFGLPDRYTDQPANNHEIATPDTAQENVYQLAAKIADDHEFRSVCDLGTGSGWKLHTYFGHLTAVGMDVDEKLPSLRQRYPRGDWRPLGAPINTDLLICADVIEHLDDPRELLATIRDAKWRTVVLSTPERSRVPGNKPLGPPRNPRHCREWTQEEFGAFLATHIPGVTWHLQVIGEYNLVAIGTR